MLARASVSLSALRNPEAIMLMSQSLEALVAGEILQVWVWGGVCWGGRVLGLSRELAGLWA